MSVLIKNMEMPTDGHILIVFPSGRVLKVSADNTQNILGEAQAIPIPPHGRLGDLNELAKVVLNWITTQEKAYPNEDSNALSWRLGARAMGHQIYRDIEAAPTIIPAEEGE